VSNNTYTESDIEVLTDQEHVRRRVNVYLGNNEPATYKVPIFGREGLVVKEFTFRPSVFKASGEIIDNAIDELTQFKRKDAKIIIETDPVKGFYSICDNGRGVPIGMHASGKHTPEVVFGSLRSGRNFKDDAKQTGVIGVNGVGSSCTNACSTRFDVTIYRDNKKYSQTFSEGNTCVSKPKITSVASRSTGTQVEFTLDPEVFKDVSIDPEMMRNRALEIAFNNPGVDVHYNGTAYKFKKGFEEVLSPISTEYFKFSDDNMSFYVVTDIELDGSGEQVFSWVNSSYLFDGGICNTQFINAFTDQVCRHLSPQAKKQKCEVSKEDVLKGLVVFGLMKFSDATYDSQAKTRLTGPNKRKDIQQLVEANWTLFVRKNKNWLDAVFQRAYDRYHTKSNLNAQKEHEKRIRSKVPGLLDANTKNRKDARLFIVEGLSAGRSIVEVRDPLTMGSIALGGKINNTYGCSVAQVLKMGKLQDLLAAIGITPGKPADRDTMNFGKIVVATDADPDGSAIFANLMSLFYQFWPELLDKNNPCVYRLIVPNVVAYKGTTRIHFTTRDQYEKVRNKYKGYKIEYMKGLGSMNKADWERVVSSDDFLIPVVSDGKIGETLKLLFGDDASARRRWLTNGEDIEGESE
jgi:topoisomerase-4 subunit B